MGKDKNGGANDFDIFDTVFAVARGLLGSVRELGQQHQQCRRLDNGDSDGGFRVYLSEVKRRCINREELNREYINEKNTYLVQAKQTCLLVIMPAVHNFHVFSA
jgi:hypothetical protein